MHLTRLHTLFGWLALAGCLFLLPTSAQAATLTVTSLADGGGACPGANCTLRDAIAAANPGDAITFAVTGTIVLGGTELAIDKSLTIQGPGANLLTISGNNASRVFNIGSMMPAINVTLSGLTIANGRRTGTNLVQGGGIFNNSTGTVNVTHSTLTNNSASASGGSNSTNFAQGGGIVNNGTLTVTNSTLANNSASASGGSNSFNGTGGGGIYNVNNGTLTVTNSTLANNSASASGGGTNQTFGGGIYNENNGTVNVKSTIVALNSVTATAGAQGPDVRGTFTSQGFNLIGKNNNSTGFTNGLNQDQVGSIALPLDPLLGALANNGGPTQTMALLAGSPALDKGNSFGLTTDQRGFARTVDSNAIANAAGGDGTDIGAFEFGAAPMLNVLVADPAVCLDPGGLVGVTATLTNPNAFGANASFIATLPIGLTAVAGTCNTDVNPGGCTIAANGSSVTWNGVLNAGQTVTIVYRARIAAGTPQGTVFTIANTANVGGAGANVNAPVRVNCPAIVNTRVSDQKPGSVLVFPYYTSTIGGGSDTRLTLSHTGSGTGNSFVHLFLIDGASCAQSDLFVCLTPNASLSFKASDYDPGNTGYVIAVAVNNQGLPIQNNVLIGNAFVNTPTVVGNYGAESFWANNALALATIEGGAATLYFDQVGYDAVPKQFAVEIQSPVDAIGQQVVTAGLNGSIVTTQLSGAAQVGTGQAFNEKEVFASFSNWLLGGCQARATVSTVSPRVPNGLGNLIKTGQAGHLKFNVGGAVGLLLTPRGGTWSGIRTLHKTQTTATTLTIPIFMPVC